MNDPALQASAAALLQQAGMSGEFDLAQLKGGGNNRVFRITLADRSLLMKAYFRHEQDPRDRLGAEFSFCRFAWDHGLRCVPQPIACNREDRLGLYEFIPGRLPTQDEINSQAVDEALRFFIELNRHRGATDARRLPIASEACFSIADHLSRVDQRVKRLGTIAGSEPEDTAAARLVADRLTPTWERIRAAIQPPAKVLGPDERRISPSDFGFHNTLVTPEGRIRFLDFEYAGWDDPAKTVCDFFCQVALPAPLSFLDDFARDATADQPDPDAARDRIRTLLPVYQVKWCCIVLNDFLPADSARRRFADGRIDTVTRKRRQLEKAEALLEGIRSAVT